MSDLKSTRKQAMADGSKVSESALLAEDSAAKDLFVQIQEMRREIVAKKTAALATIDAEYGEKLKNLESDYSFILTMSR